MRIRDITVGAGSPLLLISGLNVLETLDSALQCAEAGQQVVTGEPGDDPAVGPAGHRDRAAEGEHDDGPGSHGR